MKNRYIVLIIVIIFLFLNCDTDRNIEITEKSTHLQAGETNAFGWTVPEQEIQFEYFIKRRLNPVLESAYSKRLHEYLIDEFHININKIVYDADVDERLDLLLASNSYPPVLTRLSKNDVLYLDQLGLLIDLAPFIDVGGYNIKKELGDLYVRYVEDDGRILGMPGGWGILEIPDNAVHIRYDLYNGLGSPDINTPKDYYRILKQMVIENPYNVEGEKVYALSWNSREGMMNSINTIAGIWGLKEGFKEDSNMNLIHWIHTKEGKDFSTYFNQIYREGYLDPDSFSNSYEEWKAKFSNGRILGHIGPWWQSWNAGHEVWQKTDVNWVDEKRFIQIPLKSSQAEMSYLSPKDSTGWGYTVITDKAENIEDIVKVLDFMITPSGTRLFSWGIPNEEDSNWNIEPDGSWSFVEQVEQAIINGTYDYESYKYLGVNQYWLIHPQGGMSDDPSVNTWIDQCFNDRAKWKKLLNENMDETIYDNSAMSQIIFHPEDPILQTKRQTEEIIETLWPRVVLSNTVGEFEMNYEEMKNQLENAGIESLEKYMTENYKTNLENWK